MPSPADGWAAAPGEPPTGDPSDVQVSADVGLAVERLRRGGLVAVPTETVYGLAADAEQPDAVARIFATKGRPNDHPLIVHVAGLHTIDGWVADVDDAVVRLAHAFWPGPLTLLLRRGPRASDHVTGGRETVGVRAPDHPLTLELLDRFGGGLAAPSANRFGKVSPTTAQHVLDDLGGLLDPERDLVLDGGPCVVGVESTIVDLTVDPPQMLRAGSIAAADVERVLAEPLAGAAGPSRTSGMLASHYPPDCAVLLADEPLGAEAMAAVERSRGRRVDVLDRSDDPVVAARRLYDDLRTADRAGLDVLVVVMPAPEGIGQAVRDRLTKAAANRDLDRSDRPNRAD